MVKWLLDIIIYVRGVEIHSASDNGKRMCTVLIILVLLYKIEANIHPDDVIMVLSLLRLRPPETRDVQVPKFLDLLLVMRSIPEDFHAEMSAILSRFKNYVLYIATEELEWVYIIPLIHILSKQVKPLEELALTISEKIQWRDDSLPLYEINQHTRIHFSRYDSFQDCCHASQVH